VMLLQERWDHFLKDPHMVVRDEANHIRKIVITDSEGHKYEISSVCGGSLQVRS
jgi:hypothetical protein